MTIPKIHIAIATENREDADAIAKVISKALAANSLGPDFAEVQFTLSFLR